MTTKTLSTYAAAGYTLAAQYDTLDITATGGIGGTGLTLSHLATVSNLGSIHGAGGANGVHATAGGTIVNGSKAATAATITGYSGVFAQNAPVVVDNFGTIEGLGAYGDGVFLVVGGQVINGSARDKSAYIQGHNAGVSAGATVMATNYGTIIGLHAQGVDLQQGGRLVNGSAKNTSAAIKGASAGVSLEAGGSVFNYGTVTGGTVGVSLLTGGLINGSAGDAKAVISGATGVVVGAYGIDTTVANFGTIIGTGGTAVSLGDATDTLIVEAGCGFQGGVQGAGGELDLDGGAGTLSGLGTAAITVSGSMAPTTFSNFATIAVGVAASFVSTAAAGPAAGQAVQVSGSLALGSKTTTVASGGTLATLGGTISVKGALSTTGLIDVEAGAVVITGAATNGGAIEAGAGTLMFKSTLNDAGLIDFRGGQATVTGALTNSGTIETSGGLFTTTGSVGNTGLIEATGGQIVLSGPAANGGVLKAAGGTVTLAGLVSGVGQAEIDGGLLDCQSAFTQNVAFFGGTGTLELHDSRAYSGTIAGFSFYGGQSLDLTDISFVSSSEATYNGSLSGGVLTVNDGKHVAQLKLTGAYTHATFTAASDGHGGVSITATNGADASPGGMQAFVQNMAATAGAPCATAAPVREAPERLSTLLAEPAIHPRLQ